MIALDASVLIGLFHSRDAHHATATTLLARSAGDGFTAHAVTVAELLVGGVRTGRVERMRGLLAGMDVRLVHTDDGAPLRLAELRVRTGLKLPDCCVLDVALQHRAAVATFDDRLARAARDLGLDVVGAESAGGA